MIQNLTVRNTLALSTVFTVALVGVLLAVVFQGFSRGVAATHYEHQVSQKALVAMLGARFHTVQIQQFLTDVSATGDEEGYKDAAENFEAARKDLATLGDLLPEYRARLLEIERPLQVYHETGKRMAKAYVEQGREAGNAIMKASGDGFDARAEALTEGLEALEKEVRGRSEVTAEETESGISTARNLSLGLGGAIVALALGSGMVLYRVLVRLLGGEPCKAAEVAQRITQDDFSSEIGIRAGDETSLMVSLKRMQDALKRRITEDRRVAAENLRVRAALDHASAGVMIADSERNIIYCNAEVIRVLRNAEEAFRQWVPGFKADALVGRNIDALLRDPDHPGRPLSGLSGRHTVALRVGDRHLRVVANPVLMPNGTQVGWVAEWQDGTAEVNAQNEVANMVAAASRGDFGSRLDLESKEGFFREAAEGLNRLADVTSTGLEGVAGVLRQVAQGDLTARVEMEASGLFGQLRDDVNRTVDSLNGILKHVMESSAAIDRAAREISQGNSDLSRRTEEQAASLEETASAMSQLDDIVRQNSERSLKANELARESNGVAQKGGVLVRQVVSTMEGIQAGSRKVAEITGLIDSIAFQTNILALNAAVEAARAGEQGRGFAVVANEVRNLAQRSATAARDIRVLIGESTASVETGARLVAEAGETIEKAVAASGRVADLVTEISSAGKVQSGRIGEISRAVGQIDELTQQNAALVEEAAAAAESLESQADGLVSEVARFRLAGSAPPGSAPRQRARGTFLLQDGA